MVEIQSKEVIDKIGDDLKVQPSMEVPRELSKDIQLSYNVNPDRLIKLRSTAASDSASATIITTSTTKDTFLIAAEITISKSALATSTFSRITLTPFGDQTQSILFVRYEPTTAGELNKQISLPMSLKLERGTTINVTNSTGIASIDTTGTIYFFETDPL